VGRGSATRLANGMKFLHGREPSRSPSGSGVVVLGIGGASVFHWFARKRAIQKREKRSRTVSTIREAREYCVSRDGARQCWTCVALHSQATSAIAIRANLVANPVNLVAIAPVRAIGGEAPRAVLMRIAPIALPQNEILDITNMSDENGVCQNQKLFQKSSLFLRLVNWHLYKVSFAYIVLFVFTILRFPCYTLLTLFITHEVVCKSEHMRISYLVVITK